MARGGRIEIRVRAICGGGRLGMHLVAVSAADVLGRMAACQPVAAPLVLDVTAQADAVRIPGRSGTKADDFRHIPGAIHVQASSAVAVLAFDTLLGVKGVSEIATDLGMAQRARIRPDP
ncbi:MAG: hypothetical protein ABSF14_18350 [Terriglobia bacterium]